jgi:CBS-domain-containing membrane protein
MKIGECMKHEVISVGASSTLREAAALFVAHHIGMLPVVVESGKLVGVIQLRDLLALVMPDFTRLMEDLDFVRDFGALEKQQPSSEVLVQQVQQVMQPPVSVDDGCGLLRAFAMLRQHDLHDLPVVNADGRLVGIASRVDMGTALLSSWQVGAAEGVT